MDIAKYIIDDKAYEMNITGSSKVFSGKNEILSDKKVDITYDQPWYSNGYKSLPFLSETEFAHLKKGLTDCISRILLTHISNLSNFSLEQYHKFVTTDDLHYKVVTITRDLFPEDFNFPLDSMMAKFSKLLGFELTDIDPDTNKQLHIIVRINRPGSTDFNPPHKDIYNVYDEEKRIPRFVNLWIPVCGVTTKSSLPLVASSHLLSEKKILRTFDGGVVSGKKYRVRTILEWDGSNKMTRPLTNYGEVLMFSPNLIHGLAFNGEDDQTRISLEFRLFKKE